jgi:hydroxymethylpyrimidine kinase/phosphomethylpyrimidine kinase
MKNFLTIAASDTSGGAGIQQDIKVAYQLNYHALSAISAITSQDFKNVYHIYTLPAEILQQQLDVIMDFPILCCKIGVLGSRDNINITCEFLKKKAIPIVVLDPVFLSSGGTPFYDCELYRQLIDSLLPHCTIVTPNKYELEQIVQTPISSFKEAIEQAKAITKQYNCGIYIKGGHFSNQVKSIKEALVSSEGTYEISKKQKKFSYSHGTGCTFSTAFAIYLSTYKNPKIACQKATEFVNEWYIKVNRKMIQKNFNEAFR